VRGGSEEIGTTSVIMGFGVDVDGEPVYGFLGGKSSCNNSQNSLPRW
jgi:hypothetical protein